MASSTNSEPGSRRSFLTRIGALSGLALVSPLTATSELGAETRTTEPPTAAPAFNLAWIDHLRGRHKQVFDLGGIDLGGHDVGKGETPLRVVRNYLNAHRDVYSLAYPDINTVVGIAGEAFPINATDPIWVKYSLGEKWKIKDPKTGTWAVRNVYADPSDSLDDKGTSVQAMVKRGTIFWQCNNALNGVVQMLADAMKLEVPAVRAELVAGLMPGVHLVPAHTMALGLVQERGCTYEKM